jgi:hyperosmotically inducible protein
MRALWVFASGLLVFLAVPAAFGAAARSDARITADIQNKVYQAKVFNRGEVHVAFDAGVATLSGTVGDLGTKLDAERAAGKVNGVQRVVNNITVSADDVTPAQILEEARRRVVTYYAYSIFDNVQLEARGNTLLVSGQVTQPFKKSDLGRILTRVRGVAALDNNLEVLPLSVYDNQIRLAVARAIYGDPYFVHYANRAVPSIHIIVKNGDVTLTGAVASQLDRAKAEADARTAATFFRFDNQLRVERS